MFPVWWGRSTIGGRIEVAGLYPEKPGMVIVIKALSEEDRGAGKGHSSCRSGCATTHACLGFDCFHPVKNILNCLFDAGDTFLLGFYEAVGPVDDVHGVEGEYHFRQPSRIHIRPDFSFLFCPFD